MGARIRIGRAMTANPCKSCGADLAGIYCSRCGEKVLRDSDLTLGALLRQVVDGFLSLDGTFLRSLWLLIAKPGFLATEYVGGRRILYTKPIVLFLTANAIFFFYLPFSGFSSSLESQTSDQLYSPLIAGLVAHRFGSPDAAREFAERYDARTGELAKVLIILLVPLTALVVGLLYYARSRSFFEHLIFALYFMAFYLWLGCLLLPFVLALFEALAGALGLSSTVRVLSSELPLVVLQIPSSALWLYFAANRYYGGSKALNGLRAVLLPVALFFVLNAYRLILFFVVFYSV